MPRKLKPPIIDDNTNPKHTLPSYARRGFKGTFGMGGGFLAFMEPAFMEPLPERYLIPEEEWGDRISDAWKHKTFPYHYAYESGNVKIKNQRSTALCWQFGTTSAKECISAFQNQPPLSLSPASTAYQVTRGRMRGGYGAEAIEGLASYGAVPSEYWPDTGWGREYNTDENRELASNYRVDEWYYTNSVAGSVSLLLHGIANSAGFNWWRHQVNLVAAYFKSRRISWLHANSYGTEWGDRGFGEISGGRIVHAGAVCPRSALPV